MSYIRSKLDIFLIFFLLMTN